MHKAPKQSSRIIAPSKNPPTFSDAQLQILHLLYKFRFATTALLSQSRNVQISATAYSLQSLARHGYIGRLYEPAYKLQGKAARYFLAAPALGLLATKEGYQPSVLHSFYKNKSVTQDFVDKAVQTMHVCLLLQQHHPDEYGLYTRQELVSDRRFRPVSPDIYIRRLKPTTSRPTEYFVLVYASIEYIAVQYRLRRLVQDLTSGAWPSEYPTILLVTATDAQQERLSRIVQKFLHGSRSVPELSIYGSSLERLNNPKQPKHSLWNPFPPRAAF